jgi:hypothetical protein
MLRRRSFPDAFGIIRSRTGRGVEKCLDAPLDLDVVGTLAVHARRAAAPVAPDRAPCLREDGRITHEVVEVTEPTVRGVGSPLVQLGLDSQYLRPGH